MSTRHGQAIGLAFAATLLVEVSPVMSDTLSSVLSKILLAQEDAETGRVFRDRVGRDVTPRDRLLHTPAPLNFPYLERAVDALPEDARGTTEQLRPRVKIAVDLPEVRRHEQEHINQQYADGGLYGMDQRYDEEGARAYYAEHLDPNRAEWLAYVMRPSEQAARHAAKQVDPRIHAWIKEALARARARR